ncbi:MAG: fumarylacetoacetate hydrolase family protein [Lachnospiraceae bacterium]|nr:fumarylacetoacetate hydrolase family protein [Lachnospiraceae bacterium]
MRLFTVESGNRQYVAVEGKSGSPVTLDSLGISVNDMNELIRHFDEMSPIISSLIEKDTPKEIEREFIIKAPIPVPLQDVICLGVNYRSHIEETVDVLDFTKKKDTVYFSKRVNKANDPDGIIPLYDFVDSLDYEVELGVIIKKDALNVPADEAADYILGYTIINDVSARNIQLKHQQWYRGKSLDGYTPMGPCIVTADEIEDVHNLDIFCYVNNEMRQNSNTRYMITSVEEAISELSQGMMLKAGTIIATGTPGGVAMGMKPPLYLKSGDEIRCEIQGIGSLCSIVQ